MPKFHNPGACVLMQAAAASNIYISLFYTTKITVGRPGIRGKINSLWVSIYLYREEKFRLIDSLICSQRESLIIFSMRYNYIEHKIKGR